MSPLISLIIPCHNHAGVLPRLLSSIAAQSIAGKMEVIIVDDASDMPCAEAIAAFPDLNIRVIRLPERVYTKSARLLGMEAARGEVMAFADADDTLWGTEALEKNVRLLLEQDADIVHFPCVEVDVDLRCLRPYDTGRPLPPLLENRDIFSALVKNRVKAAPVWSKLYTRRLVQKVLEPARAVRVRRYREDVLLSLLFFWHSRKYLASPHIGYGHYAVNKDEFKAGGRAASCWHMLQDLLPWLESRGCLAGDIASLRRGLTRFMRKNLCILYKQYGARLGETPPASMLAELAEHMDTADARRLLQSQRSSGWVEFFSAKFFSMDAA